MEGECGAALSACGWNLTWQCQGDMPSNIRFGELSVSCEGWDGPNDPYILHGEMQPRGREARARRFGS